MNRRFCKPTAIIFVLLVNNLRIEGAVMIDSTDSVHRTAVPLQARTQPVTLRHFVVPPSIDGYLEDSVWHAAALLSDFVQTFPGDNIAPTFPTEVLLGYDDATLYIGIHATDAPDRVRATIAKRDDILNDDNIQIYLDTFNDRRRAYLLIFNPLGIQQDGEIGRAHV